MKKILYIIISVVMMMSFDFNVSAAKLPEVTDHEKVTIYFFYQDSTEHSLEFIEYFSDKYKDYSDYFEIVTFNINLYEDDYYLYESVAQALDEEAGYIPLIVIGSDYHLFGFGADDDGEDVIEAALDAYQDSDYTDLVAEVISSTDSEVVEKSFTDACDLVGVECSGTTGNQDSNSFVVAVIICLIVIVLVFMGIIYYTNMKNKKKK